MKRDDIFNQLKTCVGEVLIIEDEELIQPNSHLINDLGAESIDFVEIIHLASRTFDVQVERNEIYPDRDFFTEKRYYTADNKLTDEGVDALINRWPHLDKEKVMHPQELGNYLNSISLLIDFFEYKLLDA